MMTKYQLVFTKLEGHLTKVSNTVNKYDYITKFQAFQKMRDFIEMKRIKDHFAAKNFVMIIKNKSRDLRKTIDRVKTRQLKEAFGRMIKLVQEKRIKEVIAKKDSNQINKIKKNLMKREKEIKL